MICFAWNGFPQYAARCVAAFVRQTSERVAVVATRPDVPIQGMEDVVGCPVKWISACEDCSLSECCGGIPDVLFVSGWATPVFNRFRDEVRSHGGRVIVAVDNNYIGGISEWLKLVRFRLRYRRRADGFMVPGSSGMRLLRYYGVSPERVYRGLYAADSTLFSGSRPLHSRAKRILFVGRFTERKNVLALCDAFLSTAMSKRIGWELALCGCGPLRDLIPQADEIRVFDFVQPEDLAKVYGDARVFVLPSKEEHWGLVVHEAALSGCLLLLSKQVGAAEDFVGVDNGILFDAFDRNALQAALEGAMSYDRDALCRAQAESVRLSARASLALFVSEMNRFIQETVKS